jgi:hypothetical protein
MHFHIMVFSRFFSDKLLFTKFTEIGACTFLSGVL